MSSDGVTTHTIYTVHYIHCTVYSEYYYLNYPVGSYPVADS